MCVNEANCTEQPIGTSLKTLVGMQGIISLVDKHTKTVIINSALLAKAGLSEKSQFGQDGKFSFS